jgi:CRISPR/Cas system-associated exonuclease Cas4 (RecB family)
MAVFRRASTTAAKFGIRSFGTPSPKSAAAMWPAVPLIVEKNVTGTAFGLMTMIQNAGLALFPYLNGRLRVATHSYAASMVMFATLGACGFVFAVLLRRADSRAGGALELGGRAHGG